ncbi:MAG: TonB-dependent receptor domain-containing protein [Steroidobacteraceae bacterium]
MSRVVAGCVSSCLLLIPICAVADTQGPPATNSGSSITLDTIVVTGSYIRRTNAESPSPVTTIDADQIAKSGLNSIADVIRTVSADNSGTLSQAFSGAMAGGADGVALRGLTVDATLVLVDGHRMANYPLTDDGQRQFVDIDSLPMAIVDRVEVLKDGASATYGSDAIAGVVNVILKKQFTGVDVSATAGSTDRGDGLSQRFAAIYGTGNLDADGHNFYISIEGRHQQAIPQEARGSYIAASDLTPWGGPNLHGGVVNGSLPNPLTTYTVPGQVLPVSGGVVQNQTPYQLPGCSAQDVALAGGPGNGCAWDTNAYKKLQPRTAGVDVSTHWTQRLAGDWTNALAVSYYLSQSEQYRQPNAYDVGVNLVPFAWAGALSGTVNQFNPATTRIVLPSNSRDNPFNPASLYFAAAQAYYNGMGANFNNYVGDPALFFGALTSVPEQHTMYGTDVYRLVDDLTNTIGAWDLTASVGYVRDVTRITYQGFLYVPALDSALANGYLVGQDAYLNSPALTNSLVPETHDTATSDLAFLSANATRKIFALPGGDASLAVGVDSRMVHENNPGEPYALAGDIQMDGSFYARGSQTVSAAFAEMAAPVLDSLEIDAAGRIDHYNTSAGTAFTPKVGFKWTVIPQFALRATYAQGFRAPGIAESGDAGSASSVAPAPVDPVRCPVTGAIGDCGGPGSSVALLTRSNSHLKPETSHSYTFGIIGEPLPHNAVTVDYFYIRRDHEIAPEPYSLESAVRTPAASGSTLPGQIIEYLTPYVNASYSITAGIDVGWKTLLDLGRYGVVTTTIDATHLIQQQQTFGDVTYHYVGTVGPTALSGSTGTPGNRGSFILDWTLGALSLGTTLNYRSAMQGIDMSLTTPGTAPTCLQLSATNAHCYVAGFGYANLYGQYQVNQHLQLMANITNVTNRLPPLDTVTYGGQNYDASYDQAGAIGRFMELTFRYRY